MTEKRYVLVSFTGQLALPASRARAWAALHDTDMLREIVPGCQAVRAMRDGSYELRTAVPVGPLKTDIRVRLQCTDIEALRGYRLGFEGSGGLAGQGKGRVKIRLEAPSRGETLLHYDVAARIEGPLAQMGAPLVELAARGLAEGFLARLVDMLQDRQALAA